MKRRIMVVLALAATVALGATPAPAQTRCSLTRPGVVTECFGEDDSADSLHVEGYAIGLDVDLRIVMLDESTEEIILECSAAAADLVDPDAACSASIPWTGGALSYVCRMTANGSVLARAECGTDTGAS